MAGGASATLLWLLSTLLCFCSDDARGATAAAPGRRSISNATAADELALLSFKSVLDSHGSDLDSWSTSSHLCSWPGVSCGRRTSPGEGRRVEDARLQPVGTYLAVLGKPVVPQGA